MTDAGPGEQVVAVVAGRTECPVRVADHLRCRSTRIGQGRLFRGQRRRPHDLSSDHAGGGQVLDTAGLHYAELFVVPDVRRVRDELGQSPQRRSGHRVEGRVVVDVHEHLGAGGGRTRRLDGGAAGVVGGLIVGLERLRPALVTRLRVDRGDLAGHGRVLQARWRGLRQREDVDVARVGTEQDVGRSRSRPGAGTAEQRTNPLDGAADQVQSEQAVRARTRDDGPAAGQQRRDLTRSRSSSRRPMSRSGRRVRLPVRTPRRSPG